MRKHPVVHCRKAPFDVSLGRANGDLPDSKWANPWVIGKDGTRDEVIAKYEAWIKTQPNLMATLPELRDKTLGCWCYPQRCHGNVLARLVEELDGSDKVLDNPPLRGYTPSIMRVDDAMIIPSHSDVIPVFTSCYSIGASALTLEEAGKTEPGHAASICDIAKTHGLKQVTLVEDRVDGFFEAYKNIQKAGIYQLVYGLRFVVVPDMTDKTEASKRQESRVTVFLRNAQGYKDVLKLWNGAWTAGSYTPPRESNYGRLDWKMLKQHWTPNLSLALPWASSFLAKNTLTFSTIIPDFPVPTSEITLFKEIDSGLPFADLIDQAIDRFAADSGAQVQSVKSVYYEKRDDFMSYMIYRAMLNRGEFSKPNINDLSSDHFSFEDWKRLTAGGES